MEDGTAPHKLSPEDIVEEFNGSFTVHLKPWCDRPIVGIPTRGLACLIYDCAYEAMNTYADNALTE